MEVAELLDRFHGGRRCEDLPLVLEDDVEVVSGIYAGRRGSVVVLAYAESPMEYLVEFGDGTDEYFPASALKLHAPDV